LCFEYIILVVVSLSICRSVVDCQKRLVSDITCYMLYWTWTSAVSLSAVLCRYERHRVHIAAESPSRQVQRHYSFCNASTVCRYIARGKLPLEKKE